MLGLVSARSGSWEGLTTPVPVCMWGTSQIKEWLILLLHFRPQLLFHGPGAWAWSLLVQLLRAAVFPLGPGRRAAWRATQVIEK